MKIIPMEVGDILTLKKPHPCGKAEFRVLRVGSDIRIVCLSCGRDLTLPREKLEKAVRMVRKVRTNPPPTDRFPRQDQDDPTILAAAGRPSHERHKS